MRLIPAGYIGDGIPGGTLRWVFNTAQTDETPITLGGTPAVSIYKDGGTTESTEGVTLTVDFDSRTGLHLLAVNTASNTTFYASGSDYEAVITTGTVDGISAVGRSIGKFSLNNRHRISAAFVDSTHTWRFGSPSQVTAPNNISENIGFVGLLAMDFTEPMPEDASISSISASSVADIVGETEPTITTSAISSDKKKVYLTVNAASATDGTYTFTVTIVTSDSQTIARKGRLVLA